MNFSKAKTFLIIMFLAVDIFLLYTLLINSSVNPFSKDDSYEKVISILEKKNIFIETNETVLNQNNIFNLTLENISARKDSFAGSILGDFKLGEDNSFISKKGQLSFNKGEFNFVPSKKEPLNGNLLSEKCAKTVLSHLSKMGINTANLKYISTVEEKKDLYKLTFSHFFYEKKLLNSPFTVYINKDGIQRVIGGTYLILSNNSENPDLKSKEEILIRFSNLIKTDKKIYITSIEEGYYNPKQEYTTFSVIPSLKITLKSGEIYYFDLTNGKLLEKTKIY